jgi:type IV secretory pathway component VirB8
VYHITPNKRAIRGFDLTMDVVLRLVSSDNLYKSVVESPLTEYVENKFGYKKKLFGGYYNDTVYLVKYQDLRIVEVAPQETVQAN